MNKSYLSRTGRSRVYLLTALGTLFCIIVSFAFDAMESGWRWGNRPINNLLIPLLLAPPFFYYLLSKLRELAIAHAELISLSATDPLTSCLNRRAFTAMVEGYLERMKDRPELPGGTLLVLDVDHFKAVNDAYGHDKGDDALKLIATTLKDNVRDIDLVGRLGGEEFCVFMPGLQGAGAAQVADRLLKAVNAAEFVPERHSYALSVSAGGASFRERASFAELYHAADQKLYVAKRAGRNRVELGRFQRPLVAA